MYRPGTVSSLKQILQNCYMKRLLQTHYCQSPIKYRPKPKRNTKECDDFIYIYSQNQYKLYKIVSQTDTHDSFICNPQGTFKYSHPLMIHVDWEKVGVFIQGPISSDEVVLHVSQIHGKVIKIESTLITLSLIHI